MQDQIPHFAVPLLIFTWTSINRSQQFSSAKPTFWAKKKKNPTEVQGDVFTAGHLLYM